MREIMNKNMLKTNINENKVTNSTVLKKSHVQNLCIVLQHLNVEDKYLKPNFNYFH